MDAIGFVQGDLQWAHRLFRMTTGDITDEQAHWIPPGVANRIGATFSHAVCTEDAALHAMILGKKPLYTASWVDRTGISEPRLRMDHDWAREVRVDQTQIREYSEAVFAETEDYLAGLTPGELGRQIDLLAHGFGLETIDWILQALVIGHMNNMCGEISCLKGLQGAAGYPF